MSTTLLPSETTVSSETVNQSPTSTASGAYNPPILSVPSSIWGTGPATTVLNAGVLPTAFVFNPSCSSLRNLVASSIVTAGSTELQWQWFYADRCDAAAQPETQCLPEGFDSNYGYQLRPSSVDAYMPVYSEGSSCPNGYTSACEVVTKDIWLIKPGETNKVAVGCCPSNYQCASTGLSCSSHPTAGATIQGNCQDGKSTAWAATIAKDNQGIGCAPRIVYVKTRSDDSSSSNPSGGLSGGIKAAIIVPVLLAVIISCAAAYLIYRRRRRRRVQKHTPTNDTLELEGDSEPFKAEADAKSAEREIYELPDNGVLEAPDDAFSPGELSAVAKESESAAEGDNTKNCTAENQHPTRFSFDSKRDA